MRLVHESQVPIERRQSPKGAFELTRQHISLALGGVKDKGPWGGGHPFDVERVVLPPGKKNYPCHSHAAQTEHYIIVAGEGKAMDGEGKLHPIRAGDHLICLPGEAHQLVNDSKAPLEYFVIADHHPADVTTYPKTGKRQLKPEGRYVRLQDADYYEGEE
ncbi:MAG TPA: cupin domain-containing protein [Opitutaceae bacterium]|jgi:uncharacterized cupin superfamily protein|nr:cupin domain-containing protein [Opitutaceae bacterium]